MILKRRKKRGRPKKTFIHKTRSFFAHAQRVFHDRRFKGNRLSRVLRPVFEAKKAKEFIGLNLAFVVLFSGVIVSPFSAFNQPADSGSAIYAVNEVKIITERAPNRPLDSFQISQSYRLWHPAVDLKEVWGAPIYSIRKGIVEKIVYSQIGYGHFLTINHDQNLKSLYAHLGKILVEKGQEVDENTIIATVGTSGWTTGPHLHFEIWENNKPINPLTILQSLSQRSHPNRSTVLK